MTHFYRFLYLLSFYVTAELYFSGFQVVCTMNLENYQIMWVFCHFVKILHFWYMKFNLFFYSFPHVKVIMAMFIMWVPLVNLSNMTWMHHKDIKGHTGGNQKDRKKTENKDFKIKSIMKQTKRWTTRNIVFTGWYHECFDLIRAGAWPEKFEIHWFIISSECWETNACFQQQSGYVLN